MTESKEREPRLALTIRQPWADLIVNGPKRVENRVWRPTVPVGTMFFVHAAKGMTKDEYLDAEDFALFKGQDVRPMGDLPRGGIVGVARLAGIIDPKVGSRDRWWIPGQWGFVLDEVRPLPFAACKGALGFFALDVAAIGRDVDRAAYEAAYAGQEGAK